MSEFIVVLPSNVRGTDAFKNTPAHYKTIFDSAIHLPESENWEVALNEIAFVDTIETIYDEYFEYSNIIAQYVFDTPILADKIKKFKLTDDAVSGDIKLSYTDIEWDTPDFTLTFIKKRVRNVVKGICVKIVSKKDNIKLFLSKEMAIHLGLQDENMSLFAWRSNTTANLDKDEPPTFQIPFTKVGEVYYGKPMTRSQFITTLFKKTENQIKSYPLLDIVIAPITSTQAPTKLKRFPPTIKKLKRGYYVNALELLKELNNAPVEFFTYNSKENRFYINTQLCEVKISSGLSDIIGFTDQTIFLTSTETKAKLRPDLRRGIYSLYVYADICEQSRVGNTTVPLLRTINFNRGTFGETVSYIYNNPIFIPIIKSFIDSIEIIIKDDMGRNIPFEEGKTIITLQFRRL